MKGVRSMRHTSMYTKEEYNKVVQTLWFKASDHACVPSIRSLECLEA